MSLVQQIISEVTMLQRQVQDQMRLIEEFKRQNKDSISMVRTQLSGSTKGYDTMMTGALDRTEKALDKSTAALHRAEAALRRVSAI